MYQTLVYNAIVANRFGYFFCLLYVPGYIGLAVHSLTYIDHSIEMRKKGKNTEEESVSLFWIQLMALISFI